MPLAVGLSKSRGSVSLGAPFLPSESLCVASLALLGQPSALPPVLPMALSPRSDPFTENRDEQAIEKSAEHVNGAERDCA